MVLHRPYNKHSRDHDGQDEASIALLPKMPDDDKLHLVRPDSEADSSDEATPYKKAPWWSYIWVRLPQPSSLFNN
jgi:hypothetical protein